MEQLEGRAMLSAAGLGGLPNLNEAVNTAVSPAALASSLVGPGVAVSNVKFTGNAASTGSFNFNDPTVVGFAQGIVLSSGSAADVVGPNMSDWTSTNFGGPNDIGGPGDADLTALSGFQTYDASVLEFDFVPTANQVVFKYTFASDEYPEWVNTPYNDVFAFFVNGTNYAEVRQIAGDPAAPFVPVAVNNINNSNPVQTPPPVAMRPDLFRPNSYDPNGGPSAIDLELDGITHVLTFQAPVNPGVVNHMKLAIADASDGIYDSAVFIQAGSVVSNENPVADLSVSPSQGAAPLTVTANVEGEDPNGLPLTYSIDWGDGSPVTSGPLDQPPTESEKTIAVDHTFTTGGTYYVTVTVSNGALSSTSTEDVHVTGGSGSVEFAPLVTSQPTDQAVAEGEAFTFTAAAIGSPAPTVQWQVSTDQGASFVDIPGATASLYTATASLADNGNLYHAVFTNDQDSVVTVDASLTVSAVDVTAPDAPGVALSQDTGSSSIDNITSVGSLTLSNLENGASVDYSIDNGATWTGNFTPVEGANDVMVHQIDEAGNLSEATLFSFTLDTIAPAMPSVALAQDTGSSPTDNITKVGALNVSDLEPDATREYSIDNGATWSSDFSAAEGLNVVMVRQTDVAGNVGDAAIYSFNLDTAQPIAPAVSLTQDTGSSAVDKITKVGALTVNGVEKDARLEYSIDNGATWTGSFIAAEGLNTVQVRQTDVAGNVSAATVFSFTLDTTPPQLHPTFSTTQPILVGAQVTLSANATDAGGIASQTSGLINTASAGRRSVNCSATDLAGNSASMSVSYVVSYAAINVSPAAGTTIKQNASIPVSFQLADAYGLISNQVASSLVDTGNIKVSFDAGSGVSVKYNKKTHAFSVDLKMNKPTLGAHTVTIRVSINGAEVTTLTIPIMVVK